jgi:molybdopterin-guanine dinucleotide biosynthesis protein A
MDGCDKSQLRVGGRTILDRQLDALRGLVDPIWLVGDRHAHPPARDVSVLADRTADAGPLGGLEAALAAAGEEDVLLLACDMPNVTQPMLRHLISRRSGVDAVVPRTERGYHPLCAVYAQSCRAPVRRRLEAGSFRMQDLLGELRVCAVDEVELAAFGEAGRLLANVNTRADLDALESLQGH